MLKEIYGQKILAVVAHPDDEVLGCGATLSKLAKRGVNVHVLCLADGISARYEDLNSPEIKSNIKKRRSCAMKASKILGIESIEFCDFIDNRMDGFELLTIIKAVEKKIKEFEPSVIFTHHRGDLNVDHQITHAAVLTACRPLNGMPVKKIFSFETPSSTEWGLSKIGDSYSPNVYIDVSNEICKKISALGCYSEEMHAYPNSRSYEGVTLLAKKRGGMIGVTYAEAFMLVREILTRA